MSKLPEWVITLSDERPAHDVARELEQAGLRDAVLLEEIGVMTGRCAVDDVARLRRLKGVADVSPSSEIDIGPPGEPETW